jgi:hypothetical protein
MQQISQIMPSKYEQIYVAEAKKSRTVCSTGASCSPLRGRVWNGFSLQVSTRGPKRGQNIQTGPAVFPN